MTPDRKRTAAIRLLLKSGYVITRPAEQHSPTAAGPTGVNNPVTAKPADAPITQAPTPVKGN